jgi:N-acetylmuramate 1-kinase
MKQDPTSFPPAKQRLLEFIRGEFRPRDENYQLSRLSGDASTREYFRYLTESGKSFILTAYPQAFDPQRFGYKQVYDLLSEIGLPVPEIILMDGALGVVLQEDLGDESLQRGLLVATESERKKLLFKAIDYIVLIQQQGPKAVRPEYGVSRLAFDQEKLIRELEFFRRHYLGSYQKLEVSEENSLLEEFSRLSCELAAFPRFLCHRDYQVRNLMLKKARIYVIDFQDARWGPASYDLVSLLKDSIELETREIAEYQNYYLDLASRQFGNQLRENFDRQFHLMSIQRLLKALGTYGHQIAVRGRPVYERYVQGSLRRALLSLQAIPEFPYIQSIVQRELGS